MNYFYDVAVDQFVDASGSTRPLHRLSFMREEDTEMAIRLQTNGGAYTPSGTASLTFAIKATPGESAETLAIIESDGFTESSGVYTGTLALDGQSLSDVLGTELSIGLYAQLAITDDNGTIKSKVIPVAMSNDIVRGNEGTPSALPNPDDYIAARAVLYDRAQALSPTQKTQAKENIGLDSISFDDLEDVPATFPPSAHDHVVSDITPVTSQRLIGRHAGGSGDAQEVTVDGGLEFHGSGIRRAALTGDVTASAGNNATTLANTGVTAGSYTAPTLTVDAKGRITAAASVEYETPAGTADYSQPKQAAINLHHTLRLYEALRLIDNPEESGVSQVGVCHKGDSMSGIPQQIMRGLIERHGLGGFVSPNLGFTFNGFAWTFAGGAYQANSVSYRGLAASYEWFSGANHIYMPASSTAGITIPRNKSLYSSSQLEDYSAARDHEAAYTPQPKTLRFLYVKTPGGGEITVTVSQPRETDIVEVIDTDDATELAYVDIDIKNLAADITINVANTGSVSIFAGYIAYYDSGVIAWESSVGGTPMQLWANSYDDGELSQVDQDLFALLNTKGIIYLQRAADADNVATRYTEYLDATSVVEASHILLGEPPQTSAVNAALLAQNEILRAEAQTRKWTYIDLLELAGGDSALFDELGYTAVDATHHSLGAHRTMAAVVMDHIDGVSTVNGRSGFQRMTPRRFEQSRLISGFMESFGADVTLNSTSVRTSPQVTGSATHSASDERGILLDLNSGLEGSVAVNTVLMGIGPNIPLAGMDGFQFSASFYRGLVMAANARACLFFPSGVTPLTSPEDMTGAGLGLQFGNAATESGTTGISNVCVRLFYHDGTTLTYFPWSPTIHLTGGLSSTYSTFSIGWSRATGRIRILGGRTGQVYNTLYETRAPAGFESKTFTGQWVGASLYSTGSPVGANADYHLKRIIVRTTPLLTSALAPFGISP